MLASAVKGGKRPSQTVTWELDDGTALDLTGATITATIVDRISGASRVADGVFTVTDGPEGEFRWDYGTNDVATAGMFMVQFSASFGSAPTPARTRKSAWMVYE
jgi:hypothetical protein